MKKLLVAIAVLASFAFTASAQAKPPVVGANAKPPKTQAHMTEGMTTPSLAYYSALGNRTYCAPGACDVDWDDASVWVTNRGWNVVSQGYGGVRYDVVNETTIWWNFWTAAGYQLGGPIILRWTNDNGYSDWFNDNASRWTCYKPNGDKCYV